MVSKVSKKEKNVDLYSAYASMQCSCNRLGVTSRWRHDDVMYVTCQQLDASFVVSCSVIHR